MNNSYPLVSVIISCYNHEKYITDCILSVVKQTYNNIELIVIDDGSSDESPRILHELSQQYGFYFKARDNKGLSASLNEAISLSKGKYICPLGSDDIILLDKIEKQVKFLENRPDIAVCGGNIICIDDYNNVKEKQRLKPYREVGFKKMLTQPKEGPAAPTVMIRSSALKEVNGFNTDIKLEDLNLWLKLTHKGFKIAVLSDILAYYREHDNNTYKNHRMMTEEIIKTYNNYRNEPEYPFVINQFLTSMFLKVSKYDPKYAIQILRKIDRKYYSFKLFKGMTYLITSWIKSKK
ncbi:glycosyltransferase [Endozoicomonas sp. SM1973]|uniref:Glycosyltransferase n=1 Tax=Spartinivicinus marinus TaxID=2994442 RepID=A0A853IGB8_9GAMM|nr:glycosyltransferase [Spartinivicinus marinus]MCX4026103.1 glycosyltransferase [Spartinivicinus marinus]NYZ66586.1 glycosyltransferase [Spartinivicinus marinus]